MPDTRTQSAASHARYNPLYHFVALPLVTVFLVYAVMRAIDVPTRDTVLDAVLALGVLAGVVAARLMALTVQDRLIRLEETIRMQRVLPASQQGDIGQLRRRHFVALRFAPDEELPGLVRRVAAGELVDGKSIKQAIRTWRPDWFRA